MDRLKTIGTFVQIAKSRSLSKAAEELGISKALASAHLKSLEQHLGVRLVNRTTRRLALTEAGSDYLAFCNKMLDSLEAEETRISGLQAEPKGRLKVMASMAFGHSQLAPIVTDFTTRHGEVTVSLIVSDRPFSPSDFVEGAYDLGISMHEIDDASIVSSKLADGAWVACATPRYVENRPKILVPADLRAHKCLIHRSHAPDSVWRFRKSSKIEAIPVSGPLFTNSSMVLRSAVLADAGVAMMPVYAIGEDLNQGRLRRVLEGYEADRRPIYVVYPQSRYMPRRSRLFIDFLKASLKGRAL